MHGGEIHGSAYAVMIRNVCKSVGVNGLEHVVMYARMEHIA